MRDGKHPDGSYTLRAKIDLASPNFNLRDPLLYRILHEEHHNTGSKWCIYPMYDWAHGFEDSIEGITHSICALEFENHRPLYDWFIDSVNLGRAPADPDPARRPIHHPQQIEFARLSLGQEALNRGEATVQRFYDVNGRPIPFDFGALDVDYGILRPDGPFVTYNEAFEGGLLVETYNDELFGYKAAFEAFITLRDDA